MEENEEVSLKTKLQNILNEKGTKLIPENIKSDVTILGVTGNYGSDATAKSSDVLSPETFYNTNGKQIGTILPIRQAGYMTSYNINCPFDTSKSRTVCIEANIAFGYKTGTGNVVCRIVDGIIDIDNGVLVNTDSISGSSRLCFDNGRLFLYYLIAYSADKTQHSTLKIFEINLDTLASTQKASYTFKGTGDYANGWRSTGYNNIVVMPNNSSHVGITIFERWTYPSLAQHGLRVRYVTLYFDGTSIIIRYNNVVTIVPTASGSATETLVNTYCNYGQYGYWIPNTNLLYMYGYKYFSYFEFNEDSTSIIKFSGTTDVTKFPISEAYYATSTGVYTYDDTFKKSISMNIGRGFTIIPGKIFTKTDMNIYEYEYDGATNIRAIESDSTYSNYFIEANGNNNVLYRSQADVFSYYADDKSGKIIALTRDNITYHAGYDVTAQSNDVLSPKTFYNSMGKQMGSIIPITEANDIDYVASDLQSSDIVAVDYANKCCVKKISNMKLEFYQFNGDGIIETSKIEMEVGATSLANNTRFVSFSFSNYIDSNGYIWLYTVSVKNSGKSYYINVFRIDIENQSYDVFETVTSAVWEYEMSGDTYMKILPRPNKNQFCSFGWTVGGVGGVVNKYACWIPLLIDIDTNNNITINRYNILDVAFFGNYQVALTSVYVNGNYSSDGSLLYLSGQAQYSSTKRVIYGLAKISDTNLVQSTISYSNSDTSNDVYFTIPLSNNYIMKETSIYNVLDLDNAIVENILPFNTNKNYNIFVLDKYVLYAINGSLLQYEFNSQNLTFTLNETQSFESSSNNMQPANGKQVMYIQGTKVRGYVATDSTAIVGFTRNGKTFLDTNRYNLPANMAVQGYTFASLNNSQIGTMPDNGEINITPSTTSQNIPAGYTSGGTVSGDENLIAENIKAGVTIFGVTGTYEGPDASL